MGSGEVNILFVSGIILIISLALCFILYNYLKVKKLYRELREEAADIVNVVDQKVKARTAHLEMIRDSVSEYAVQKFELAQELELRNQQILKQQDDLIKQSDKLRQAYEEIKKLDNFKHQMTRMIIHDLKNPLNVLLNIPDTMTQESGPMIKRISREMLDLVMNILDVNKFENSKMKINYEDFDLLTTVKRLVEKFTFSTLNSGIAFEISMPDPCFINSDEHIIERVLNNLISNAVRFTSPGGCIQIVAMDYNDKIKVEVIDNGTGIPALLLNKIFDEYVHEETSIYRNSTGLGLTYCKLAMEAHGEEIGVRSKQGDGTTIWFSMKKGQSDSQLNAIKTSNPPLTEEDIILIKPYLEKIKLTGIYEASAIIKLLCIDVFDSNERLKNWKAAVQNAAFSADEKQFRELTDLY